MPTDADARGGAGGNPVHSDENSPDLVGEELGDGARIWRVYDEVAREEDRERIGNWNRGLDNLALFAGLFSAVTTAVIIQLQENTQPDYARLTFLVLNASAAGTPFHDEPFAIDRDVRTTNCLWISSLMLSLTAALIAIMGKDWVGMYASRPVCNPRQWAEIRTYRVACVERWYMSGVIASAPVLLHISLVLFAAGLVIFVSQDPFSQRERVAIGLALAAGGLYVVTVLSAIVFPTSPYKSPATRAVRSAIASISASLYGLLIRPRKKPVALLQQATLIISAALTYPLPTELLPPGLSQRRRLSLGSIRVLRNCLSPRRAAGQTRSWRDTATAARAHLTAFAIALPGLFRSALDEYRYRGQRPLTKPWRASALSFLRQIDLSDRWTEVRGQPTPILIAQSLSDLNAMTQSPDVFYSVLIALGDIAIGRQVAPLVSFDLKSRLATEIRHNWPKVDLITLSRFILADRHLSGASTIPWQVCDRFRGNDKTVRSESIVFALVELQGTYHSDHETISRYLPDILIQPRGLWYLFPIVTDYPTAVVLADRYWDHLSSDQFTNLDKELRRLLVSTAAWNGISDKLDGRPGGRAGLLHLLVVSLDYLSMDSATLACALMIKVLDGKEYSSIVYAFGHDDPRIAAAAWAAVRPYRPLQSDDQYRLQMALPLAQFLSHRWAKGVYPPVSVAGRAIDPCLVRTIVTLLSPSRYFSDATRPTSGNARDDDTTIQLCVRYLHMQLRHHRRTPDQMNELTIIALMLKNVVLHRVCSAWWRTMLWKARSRRERGDINILIAIARRLTSLMASGAGDDYNTGAELFCLFSFSRTTDYQGLEVTWDLGSFLHDFANRLPVQSATSKIGMRRLLSVLRALRPLCVPREDLSLAWERIGRVPDVNYYESFWDAEDFELGPLLNPESHTASIDGAAAREDATLQVATEEWSENVRECRARVG